MEALYNALPLERPDAQIRLLHGLPGQNDEFELKVHDLDPEHSSVPEYIAVSYTWGDKEPAQPITVNGHVVQVRPHCWQALCQLRSHYAAVTLWIDSICINQNKIKEKNNQVAFMGTIYKRARSVAACLGPRSDSVFQKFHTALNAHPSEASRLCFAALRALGETPYFSRMWIKQEIILAAEITLYTSQHILTWDDVEKLITASHAALTTSKKPRDAFVDRVVNVNDDRVGRRPDAPGTSILESKWQEGGCSKQGLSRPAIVEEMLRYGDSDCEDPRDRIYALLSLVPNEDPARRLFQVDYNLSPLGFVHQAARGLSELHSASDFQPDVLSLIRKILQWFDGDRVLMQNLYRLTLDRLPTRPSGGTILKLFVKEKLTIHQPRGHTSYLPTGRLNHAQNHPGAAYLSKNICVSTKGQLESREDDHEFVADLAPCQDAAIQYKFVEEARFHSWHHPWAVYPKSSYCQYYLVNNAVGVGDILARVRWDWSIRDHDSSESHAILRRGKDPQNAENLRFHSWALPLDLAIVYDDSYDKSIYSGTQFGGSSETNGLAYRFFHPEGFKLPARGSTFAFSLEYTQKGGLLDGSPVLSEPAPRPALDEASTQFSKGPPEMKNKVVIDDILQVHHEDAVRLVLAEIYDIRLLRLQSDTDDGSSHAVSLPENGKLGRQVENCCHNLCIGLVFGIRVVFGCPLYCCIGGESPLFGCPVYCCIGGESPLNDTFFEKTWKKFERRLDPQDFRRRFPRDSFD